MVSFIISPTDSDKIAKIVSKVNRKRKSLDLPRLPPVDLTMDLIVYHNKEGLDLDKLLAANEFTMAHDVMGIRNNLNRTTGSCNNSFLPRCHKENKHED